MLADVFNYEERLRQAVESFWRGGRQVKNDRREMRIEGTTELLPERDIWMPSAT